MTPHFRSFFRFSYALLAVFSGTTAGRAAPPERPAPGLHVTAALAGGPTRVPHRFAKYAAWNNQSFPILLSVTNLSRVPRSFHARGYSWQQNWRMRAVGRRRRDEMRLQPAGESYVNTYETITLKPGERYERQGVIIIRSAGPPHRVHFRFDFAARPNPDGRLPVTESNEVTATLKWAP